jgi:hypothetical protein
VLLRPASGLIALFVLAALQPAGAAERRDNGRVAPEIERRFESGEPLVPVLILLEDAGSRRARGATAHQAIDELE